MRFGLVCLGNCYIEMNLVVVGNCEEEVIRKLNVWREGLEKKGLRVTQLTVGVVV